MSKVFAICTNVIQEIRNKWKWWSRMDGTTWLYAGKDDSKWLDRIVRNRYEDFRTRKKSCPWKYPLGVYKLHLYIKSTQLVFLSPVFTIFPLPNVKTCQLCYRQQACHAINKCSWCKHCGMACQSLSFCKLYAYSTPYFYRFTHAKTKGRRSKQLCSNHEATGILYSYISSEKFTKCMIS